MLQLKNNTPFATNLTFLYDKEGVDTLFIMVSAAFTISRKLTLLDEQIPPRGEDEYWTDEPATSSLKYTSDFHLGKPFTDVVMLGHARAPHGKKVSKMDVGLRVGQISKSVCVFGDRQWQGGLISKPQHFEAMPLVYERAYGGAHNHEGDIISAEMRNLVGSGYLGKQKTHVLDGTPVPNIEDPRQLLYKAGDVVTPAGFGFISPNWQPRVQYAGTYDDAWKTTRAPFLPLDFDSRFFNMAHPDLIYPGYLLGGEPVQIQGVHPGGTLQFTLPVIHLTAKVRTDKKDTFPTFNLETVILEPDEMRLSLNWKAALPCDKSVLKINEVILNLSRTQRQVA